MSRPVRARLLGSTLPRLLDATPKGWLQLVLTLILAAAATGASVALMGVAAWLLSRAAEHPPFMYLTVAALGVRFFGISRGVFRYLERLVGHDLALRLQSALRLETYTRLARTTLLGRRRGDLLLRLVADIEAVQDLLVRVVVPFASSSLVILGTTLILGRFSPASAAVLLGSAVLAGIVVPRLAQRATRAVDEAAVPTRGELGTQVHEMTRAATDLVAYAADGPALDRLLETDDRLRRIEARGAWVRGVAAAAQTLAAGLAVVGALVLGGQAVADGRLAPRLLAVLVLTPLALHEAPDGLAQAAQTATRARAALARVRAVLEAPLVGSGDRASTVRAEHPGIEAAGLAAGWPGEPPIVTGLDLNVRRGDTVALTGRSGVGKTTTAATIMGLIPPQGGELVVRGTVGYLAQDAHLFATTLAENVRIGNKDASDAEVSAALTRAGLALPLNRLVGEQGATLSGGEARRVALARLLVGDPQVLVLDEPSEHLDRETADALADDIFATADERPLLLITHDPDLVRRCSRVVSLDHLG